MGSCAGKPQTVNVITVETGNQASQRPQSRYSEGATNNKHEKSLNREKKDEDGSYFANNSGIPSKNNQKQEVYIPSHEPKNSQCYITDSRIVSNIKEEDVNDLDVNLEREV